MRTRRLVLGLGAAAMLVAACGGAAPGPDGGAQVVPEVSNSEDGASSTPPGSDASVDEGSTGDGGEPAPEAVAALDFEARAVGGGTVDGTAYAGTRTVLWVWAPWCPQCNREAPNVKAAVERFGDDLTIIGVAGKDTDAEHEAFVDRHDLAAIPHAIDDDGSLWAKYGVGYQPAWVFIAEDGTTRVVAGGLYDDLEPTLEDFLNS